ncbi:MAG: hypothetical protein GY790_10600, partial [Bacteroidetes bacterium]|nr:hypothetical protein [Bacteroidota bacterium]
MKKLSLLAIMGLATLFACQRSVDTYSIQIEVDQQEVLMGRTVRVEAQMKNHDPDRRMLLLPFVNGRRWGSHEFADGEGKAAFVIPLPHPGPALIQVLAVEAETDTWLGLRDETLLRTGTYMPEGKIQSNLELVHVKNRQVERPVNGNTLFGVQWESWFVPGGSWITAQGPPIMGIYDSTDPDVYRQQILWFMDMGVDFIIPDWS